MTDSPTIALFDIDGTLLTTAGAGAASMRLALSQEFSLTDPTIEIDFAGRTDRGIIRDLLAINHLPKTAAFITRLQTAYLNHFPTMLRKLGGSLLPGAESLVRHCRRSPHVQTHVMTGNCRQSAWEKLSHFGLDRWVETVFGGENATTRTDLAHQTAAHLSLDPDCRDGNAHAVVIGDTPADVLCGKAIGATTIAVATGRFEADELKDVEPDLVVDELNDPRIDLLLKLDRFR